MGLVADFGQGDKAGGEQESFHDENIQGARRAMTCVAAAPLRQRAQVMGLAASVDVARHAGFGKCVDAGACLATGRLLPQ